MKEFLVTNENGSYANMEITGNNLRMYSGYLVASLTPPQDRVVVLEWVSEKITDCNGKNCNTYSPDFLPGLKNADYEETCFMPVMKLSSDILDFSRTIMFANSTHDMVKIVYDYTNKTDHDIKVCLKPQLTFRRPDSPVKIGELNFDANTSVSLAQGFATLPSGSSFTASFVPHVNTYPDIKCNITLMAGIENSSLNVTSALDSSQQFCKDHRYLSDEATGEQGVELWGVCYTPYSLEFTISANANVKASILCEIRKESDAGSDTDLDTQTFFNTTPESFIHSNMPRWEKNLTDAHVKDIADKFTDHPETAELYKDLIISARKFITRKSGTVCSTVMAGYPWFLDWGRDTMIAYTGLLLVTGRFETARGVLRSFARFVKNGMVPNVFSGNSAEAPQYNTVDASLWFFYAVDMYAEFSGDIEFVCGELMPVLREIIALYTRSEEDMLSAPKEKFCYGIYTDNEGFVHAGTDASDQLTWMDVRIDGKAVTPRHDCPIEIQALMYNALCVMQKYDSSDSACNYKLHADKLSKNCMLFYNKEAGCLYDYIEGKPGNRSYNMQLRPNQIWAVSLPYSMFDGEVARKILNTVKDNLVVDLGLRSLSASDLGYIGKYEGCLKLRDRAYHNGTSWGFLTGHYILAYLKFFGKQKDTFEYIHKLLKPYLEHSREDGCIYGIAEVFDGDAPKTGKGCYNQAWSVGCLIEAIYAMYKSM